MTQLDAIRGRARADLTIVTERGNEDVFLWEHSVRVAQTAEQIARLSAVRAHAPDDLIVQAASLYHDAAWAVRVRDGEITRYEVHIRPPPPDHREQSAIIMEQSLADLLPPDSLARTSLVVQSVHDRETDLIEGHIIADAENLEEFGLLSLWSAIRRGALEGRGVEAVIDTWQKKTEYQFWTAHLADSFRFAPVRAIAQKRLDTLVHAMDALEGQHHGADITTTRAGRRRTRRKRQTVR